MNRIFFIILSIIIFPLSSHAGSQYYGCDKKITQLEKQLSYAKRYGNKYRVAGLERAIANTQNHCYDHYSGATGATRYSHDDAFIKNQELVRDIEILKNEIDRLTDYKNQID